MLMKCTSYRPCSQVMHRPCTNPDVFRVSLSLLAGMAKFGWVSAHVRKESFSTVSLVVLICGHKGGDVSRLPLVWFVGLLRGPMLVHVAVANDNVSTPRLASINRSPRLWSVVRVATVMSLFEYCGWPGVQPRQHSIGALSACGCIQGLRHEYRRTILCPVILLVLSSMSAIKFHLS